MIARPIYAAVVTECGDPIDRKVADDMIEALISTMLSDVDTAAGICDNVVGLGAIHRKRQDGSGSQVSGVGFSMRDFARRQLGNVRAPPSGFRR